MKELTFLPSITYTKEKIKKLKESNPFEEIPIIGTDFCTASLYSEGIPMTLWYTNKKHCSEINNLKNIIFWEDAFGLWVSDPYKTKDTNLYSITYNTEEIELPSNIEKILNSDKYTRVDYRSLTMLPFVYSIDRVSLKTWAEPSLRSLVIDEESDHKILFDYFYYIPLLSLDLVEIAGLPELSTDLLIEIGKEINGVTTKYPIDIDDVGANFARFGWDYKVSTEENVSIIKEKVTKMAKTWIDTHKKTPKA